MKLTNGGQHDRRVSLACIQQPIWPAFTLCMHADILSDSAFKRLEALKSYEALGCQFHSDSAHSTISIVHNTVFYSIHPRIRYIVFARATREEFSESILYVWT